MGISSAQESGRGLRIIGMVNFTLATGRPDAECARVKEKAKKTSSATLARTSYAIRAHLSWLTPRTTDGLRMTRNRCATLAQDSDPSARFLDEGERMNLPRPPHPFRASGSRHSRRSRAGRAPRARGAGRSGSTRVGGRGPRSGVETYGSLRTSPRATSADGRRGVQKLFDVGVAFPI